MAKKISSKRDETISLTVADRFFIEQHGEMSQADLSASLNKPVEIIEEYVLKLGKEYARKKKSRANDLMSRPAKRGGVVSMTEAASMVGDESAGRYVTLEGINRAISEGNHELAKELKQRYEQQQQDNKQIIRSKYSDKIHYIQTPDDDAEVY